MVNIAKQLEGDGDDEGDGVLACRLRGLLLNECDRELNAMALLPLLHHRLRPQQQQRPRGGDKRDS